jgi:hypothetical protein
VSGEITYGEFGRQFFSTVLHERRIEDSLAAVLGDRISLGPIGAGPGRVLAKVTADGTIGRPVAEAVPGDFVSFRVLLPVKVDFDLDIAVDVHRFRVDLVVPLHLTARAAAPLTIAWDIVTPHEDELEVEVRVDRRSTAVLRKVANIDVELRRFMLRYVARELEKEHVQRATRIRLDEVIDAAWPAISAQFLDSRPVGSGRSGDVSQHATSEPGAP